MCKYRFNYNISLVYIYLFLHMFCNLLSSHFLLRLTLGRALSKGSTGGIGFWKETLGGGWSGGPKTPKKPQKTPFFAQKPQKTPKNAKKTRKSSIFWPFFGCFWPISVLRHVFGRVPRKPGFRMGIRKVRFFYLGFDKKSTPLPRGGGGVLLGIDQSYRSPMVQSRVPRLPIQRIDCGSWPLLTDYEKDYYIFMILLITSISIL